MFNGFLHKVKGDLMGTRYSSFWEYIVSGETSRPGSVPCGEPHCLSTEGLTLITSSECGASCVADTDARNVSEQR